MEILCLKKVVNQLICGIQEKFIKGSGPVLRPPEGGGGIHGSFFVPGRINRVDSKLGEKIYRLCFYGGMRVDGCLSGGGCAIVVLTFCFR
jgi:hypothetical protein